MTPGHNGIGHDGPGPTAAATCSACGTQVAEAPLTWARATAPRGTTWTCDACTRRHLRSMEARLDEEHW